MEDSLPPAPGQFTEEEKEKRGYRIKFVLVGDKGVGKTILANNYEKDDNVLEPNQTVGKDERKINCMKNGIKFVIKIIDMSSDIKKFDFLVKDECSNADYVLLIFDITNRNSFISIKDWIELCNSSENNKKEFILIGNKNDLEKERKVTKEEADKFANENKMNYHDISALNEEDVLKIYDGAFESYYDINESKKSFARDLDLSNSTLFSDRKSIKLMDKKPKDASCC